MFSMFSVQLMISVTMVAAILCVVASNPGASDCLVPSEVDLLSVLIRNGGVVLSLPAGGSGISDPTVVFEDYGAHRPAAGHSDITPVDWHCPVGEKPRKGSPLNEISSCPWRYVLDRDPTRYPETVFHAVRRCGSCLGPGGTALPGTMCEPVTYKTKALRQEGCDHPGGAMQYTVENLEQVVAFQCIAQ